jgi:uncharacterized membrane protein
MRENIARYMRKEHVVGILLIIVGISIGILFYNAQQAMSQAADAVLAAGGDCTTEGTCLHEQAANYLLLGAIPALIVMLLGVYIAFFFEVSEYKVSRNKDEQFELILRGLDSQQQEAMRAISKDDGVTQSTLKYRVSMSKSKLSQTLSELEERKLINRTPDKKTKRVHLKI